MRLLSTMLLVCGCAAFAACAEGTDVAATFSSGEGSTSGGGSGGGGLVVGTTSSTAASSSSSSGSGGSDSGGGSGGDGGGGCDYNAPTTCLKAEQLTTINGDKNSDKRTVTGTTSNWFKVFVQEGVSSIFSASLSYTATLMSPKDANFDLYVYEGDISAPNCLVNARKATGGNPESVSVTWNDQQGHDDGRWITLEVRYGSGDGCGPTAQWTLTVQGHTAP